MGASFRNKTISGMIWKAMESGGSQLVRLVISIVLARKLDLEHYSTLTLVLIFINLADVFVKRGFSTAILQRKDADNLDFSSVLWASLVIAVALYAALFFTAPAIAVFYEQPVLVPALRTLSLILFTGAFNSVQQAIVQRKLEFRKIFMASLGTTLVSGGVGIYMAYAGYGVWALIVQQMLGSVVSAALLWLLDRWKPMLAFSWERTRHLFGFGWKLLLSSLLDTGYGSLSSLVIGKRFIGKTLASYERGRQYPEMIANNLTSVALAVLFPAYASNQDDRGRVREMVRKTNRSAALMIFPMMAGMAAVATLMIRVLLTEKWMPCVPYLRLMCVAFAFYPLEAIDLQAINAIGRSDVYLITEIVKKLFGIGALTAAVFGFSTPLAIAGAVTLTAVFSMLVTMIVMKRLYGYRLREQISDLLPPLLLSGVMVAVVLALSRVPLPDIALLAVQIISGIAVYVALAVLCKLQSFTYLYHAMKGYFFRRRSGGDGERGAS